MAWKAEVYQLMDQSGIRSGMESAIDGRRVKQSGNRILLWMCARSTVRQDTRVRLLSRRFGSRDDGILLVW